MNVALKSAIVSTGLRQYKIAQMLNMHESQLSKIVTGIRPAREDEKKQIAELFEMPVDSLFPQNN